MNYTDTSIGLLEALSRSRELTPDETAELARLMDNQRRNLNRRRKYRTDAAYRERMKVASRVGRRGEVGRKPLTPQQAVAMRARDASGRFQ